MNHIKRSDDIFFPTQEAASQFLNVCNVFGCLSFFSYTPNSVPSNAQLSHVLLTASDLIGSWEAANGAHTHTHAARSISWAQRHFMFYALNIPVKKLKVKGSTKIHKTNGVCVPYVPSECFLHHSASSVREVHQKLDRSSFNWSRVYDRGRGRWLWVAHFLIALVRGARGPGGSPLRAARVNNSD